MTTTDDGAAVKGSSLRPDAAREQGGFFLLGAMLGAAVGAVVGLLYAPHPGRETRQELGRLSEEVRSKPGKAG